MLSYTARGKREEGREEQLVEEVCRKLRDSTRIAHPTQRVNYMLTPREQIPIENLKRSKQCISSICH